MELRTTTLFSLFGKPWSHTEYDMFRLELKYPTKFLTIETLTPRSE